MMGLLARTGGMDPDLYREYGYIQTSVVTQRVLLALATPSHLRAWLLQQPPTFSVGTIRDCTACPLWMYLASALPDMLAYLHVGSDNVKVRPKRANDSFGREVYVDTPQWARVFIAEVDTGIHCRRSGDGTAIVTAAHALESLDVALLRMGENPEEVIGGY